MLLNDIIYKLIVDAAVQTVAILRARLTNVRPCSENNYGLL